VDFQDLAIEDLVKEARELAAASQPSPEDLSALVEVMFERHLAARMMLLHLLFKHKRDCTPADFLWCQLSSAGQRWLQSCAGAINASRLPVSFVTGELALAVQPLVRKVHLEFAQKVLDRDASLPTALVEATPLKQARLTDITTDRRARMLVCVDECNSGYTKIMRDKFPNQLGVAYPIVQSLLKWKHDTRVEMNMLLCGTALGLQQGRTVLSQIGKSGSSKWKRCLERVTHLNIEPLAFFQQYIHLPAGCADIISQSAHKLIGRHRLTTKVLELLPKYLNDVKTPARPPQQLQAAIDDSIRQHTSTLRSAFHILLKEIMSVNNRTGISRNEFFDLMDRMVLAWSMFDGRVSRQTLTAILSLWKSC
jgi:hypothetical protein